MKKLFLTAAIMLAMASCSNDDFSDMNQSGMSYINASSENDGSVVLRSGLAESNDIVKKWEKDDAISLFSGSMNQKLTVCGGYETTDPVFSGNYEEEDEYYAVFPYNADNKKKYTDTDVTIAWNGTEQVAVKGSIPKNAPLMAYVKANDDMSCPSLVFKDVCAYIKFSLYEECKSVKITANDPDHYLSANRIVAGFDANDVPQIYLYGGGCNSVTLVGENGSTIDPGTYYVAVAPGKMCGGLKMEVTPVCGDVCTSTLNTDVDAQRKCVLDVSDLVATKTLAGSGTLSFPYLVSDYKDLLIMQQMVNSGEYNNRYFKQTADINANGKSIEPIGTLNVPFSAIYDGGNHKISNLTYKGSVEWIGYGRWTGNSKNMYRITSLFGVVVNATIKNLTVENPEFTFDPVSREYMIVSPLVGSTFGEDNQEVVVSNCTVKGSYHFNEKPNVKNHIVFGGIVGITQSHATIKDCTNNYSFNCNDANELSIGGIVGESYNGLLTTRKHYYNSFVNINGCTNNAKFDASASTICIGGIISAVVDQVGWGDVICGIYNSVNNGLIYSYNGKRTIGGIVGKMDSDGYNSNTPRLMNCVNNANITGLADAGGIVGYCYDNDTQIIMCVNTGYVYANNAIVGCTKYGDMRACWNTSTNVEYLANAKNQGKDIKTSECGTCSIDEVAAKMNNYVGRFSAMAPFNLKKWTRNGDSLSLTD